MIRERSEAQKEASRQNGARSHGPITEEGKAISSRNALRHGLVANTVLIPGESPEEFQRLLAGQILEFEPQTPNELMLVEAMVVAKWRQMRAWGLTAAVHAREIHAQDEKRPEAAVLDMATRAWIALEEIDKSGSTLRRLHQYEGRYAGEFLRNRQELLDLRRARLNPAIPPEDPSQKS
ncbi:MAG TPA: hypothetical protein VKB79_10520 [Bryobacteraceae bacterium]|nr:hypothetical protein [Bryobacteraceae bacterium]